MFWHIRLFPGFLWEVWSLPGVLQADRDGMAAGSQNGGTIHHRHFYGVQHRLSYGPFQRRLLNWFYNYIRLPFSYAAHTVLLLFFCILWMLKAVLLSVWLCDCNNHRLRNILLHTRDGTVNRISGCPNRLVSSILATMKKRPILTMRKRCLNEIVHVTLLHTRIRHLKCLI